MSKADVERVITGYWDALRSGEFETALGYYADDLVFHYYGHNPIAGDYVGKAACLEVLRKIGARTNRKVLDILEMGFQEERGTVIARESFERDGQVAVVDRTFIYRIAGEKIAEVWILDKDQQTVDRFLAD